MNERTDLKTASRVDLMLYCKTLISKLDRRRKDIRILNDKVKSLEEASQYWKRKYEQRLETSNV